MPRTIVKSFTCVALGLLAGAPAPVAHADPFTQEDAARWEAEFRRTAETGRALWVDPKLGTNSVTCGQCHPNAANTHPETYPKFQKQLGRVVLLWEMIDWCLQNPLEGKPLAPDDPKLVALQAYIMQERRGVPLEPGKH
jgi:thiosulfate dehydrogenase